MTDGNSPLPLEEGAGVRVFYEQNYGLGVSEPVGLGVMLSGSGVSVGVGVFVIVGVCVIT